MLTTIIYNTTGISGDLLRYSDSISFLLGRKLVKTFPIRLTRFPLTVNESRLFAQITYTVQELGSESQAVRVSAAGDGGASQLHPADKSTLETSLLGLLDELEKFFTAIWSDPQLSRENTSDGSGELGRQGEQQLWSQYSYDGAFPRRNSSRSLELKLPTLGGEPVLPLRVKKRLWEEIKILCARAAQYHYQNVRIAFYCHHSLYQIPFQTIPCSCSCTHHHTASVRAHGHRPLHGGWRHLRKLRIPRRQRLGRQRPYRRVHRRGDVVRVQRLLHHVCTGGHLRRWIRLRSALSTFHRAIAQNRSGRWFARCSC